MKNNKAKFKNQRWFQGGQFRLPMTFLERLPKGLLTYLSSFCFLIFLISIFALHFEFWIVTKNPFSSYPAEPQESPRFGGVG